jgi:16S rRNA G1207 methylase RsmC
MNDEQKAVKQQFFAMCRDMKANIGAKDSNQIFSFVWDAAIAYAAKERGEREQKLVEALQIAVDHFDKIIAFGSEDVSLEVYKEIVHNETADEFNEVASVRKALAAYRRET